MMNMYEKKYHQFLDMSQEKRKEASPIL